MDLHFRKSTVVNTARDSSPDASEQDRAVTGSLSNGVRRHGIIHGMLAGLCARSDSDARQQVNPNATESANSQRTPVHVELPQELIRETGSLVAMILQAPVHPPMPPASLNLAPRTKPHPESGNSKRQPAVGAGVPPLGSGAQHLSRHDPKPRVFVGTGGRNRADLAATERSSRTEPLERHEIQQAGYQLAAKLNGTSIAGLDEHRRLADANQTMHDTRLALKHGRGNVEADCGPSGGYSVIASVVSEQLAGPNDSMLAGTALALGAGKCDHYAEINNRVHSQKLGAREAVHGMVNSRLGLGTAHTWSEVHKRPKPGETKPSPIVMDSWASGPAARLEDTVWGAHSRTTKIAASFGKISGKSDFDKMQEIRNLYGPGGERHPAAMALIDERRRRPVGGKKLEDVQIIEPQFAAHAREKLQTMSAFAQEIMAVGAAREAYGLNVAQAAKLTTTIQIIDEAGRLDRQGRPPVVRPPYQGQ